jgi:large subunit ribosomal protein L22e
MVKVRLHKKVKQVITKTQKFYIDCQLTVEDNVISVQKFAKWLREHIKVDGKKNNLGDKITVTAEDYGVTITAKGKFSKRYLKYLSKKYLKKEDMREFLRVIATNKNSYQLRYFKVNEEEEDDENED